MYTLRIHATPQSCSPRRSAPTAVPISAQSSDGLVPHSPRPNFLPGSANGTERSRLRTYFNGGTTTIARGMGENVVGSWLDLSKLVSSDAEEHKSAFPELARELGAEVYVDINGWHLYLKDISVSPNAKLHTLLAQQLAPDLLSKGFNERKIDELLKTVPLNLGGGKTTISLFDAIPSYPLDDLMRICKAFAEDK